ncbi:MAG: hypothetical protein Q4A37_00430 [Candidatus Saccharibacteria bacterium]|nr:hypothetical protein [Candidatus Saccharibacteria bacterium]
MPEQYAKNPEVISKALQDAFAAYAPEKAPSSQPEAIDTHVRDTRVGSAAAQLMDMHGKATVKSMAEKQPNNEAAAYVKQAAVLLAAFRKEYRQTLAGRR